MIHLSLSLSLSQQSLATIEQMAVLPIQVQSRKLYRARLVSHGAMTCQR